MDWGAGHLTIIVGMGGGAFANKKFLNNFFKCLGYAWGFCPGGGGGGGDAHGWK